MPVTTTLAAICAAGPCDEGIRKLLKHLGKTVSEARKDETPLDVLTVLDSNGMADALWVLDRVVGNTRICRQFAADCAERVHHIFAADRPDDDRPMIAIRVARDPNATDEQLVAAAWAASAAASAAARAAYAAERSTYAASAAARATYAAARATYAASAAARAASAAARAASAAARAAAWAASAAYAAARAASAASAAYAAERVAQKSRLRQYFIHGEAAASMPWPDQSIA